LVIGIINLIGNQEIGNEWYNCFIKRDWEESPNPYCEFRLLAMLPHDRRAISIGATMNEDNGTGYVYLIKPVGHNVYKIGCTTNLEKRKLQQEKKLKTPLEYVHFVKSNHYQSAEQAAHIMFSNSHLSGEWFILTDEDVEKFKSIKDGVR
jgi:hypothetical protein